MGSRLNSFTSFVKSELVERLYTLPVAGVDAGSSAIKVVEAARGGDGRVILRRCVTIPAEAAAEPKQLRGLLRAAGIRTTQIVLGISSPEVVVRMFQCPPMPKKELGGAVRIEAESAVLNGHSLDDMALDWQVFPSHSKEALRGVLAVVPKAALAAPVQAARAAGFKPVVMDVEGLALWNAYWALIGCRDAQPSTTVLINVGTEKTNLVIAKGPNELLLARDFKIGSKALAAGQQKEWLAEVTDSLGYARSKAGLRAVDSAHLTGGGAGPELIAMLQPILPVPVALWNPFEQTEREGQALKVQEALGPLFTVAIGLALRRIS